MTPDLAPTVALTDEVSRSIHGAMQIPYEAKDDYRVTGGMVEIMLRLDQVERKYGLALEPETTTPIRLEIPLPFNGEYDNFQDTITEDLADHPWAGLPVKIVLNVFDDAKNVGAINPIEMAMPGKRFFDTLAGSIAEQRRDILWNKGNTNRVHQILKALSYLPEDGFHNERAYLLVRSVIRRLDYNLDRPISDTIRDNIAKTLWRAALLLEDGDLSDAAEKLRRAKKRLSEAMKNGATDDEIAQLMQEMREATKDYIQQLAENASPQEQQAENENSRNVSPDMIKEMMNRIQELMEQGRMDEAQEMLNQLQQMLENMQVTKGEPQQGETGSEMSESFQDTLQQQQELADENFQQMQEEFNRNQNQQAEGDQPDGGQENRSTDQQELSDRQEALRDMMNQQMQQLGDDDSEAGNAARQSLEQAERNMGRARDSLRQGRGGEALDHQADAVEALRDGMRQLNETTRQGQTGQRQNGQPSGETEGPDGKDPLGRSTAKRGSAQGNKDMLNDSLQQRRSNEIMREIRKRSGDRSRPKLELDYLDRLLDRF